MNTPFTSQITFLGTTDLERSHHFYTHIMGFRLEVDQKTCRIYHITDTMFIGVCQRSEKNTKNDVIFTLITEDVDGWAQTVQSRGGHVAVPPRYNEQYQIYQCFVHDPDGNVIEIQRFLHPFPRTHQNQ